MDFSTLSGYLSKFFCQIGENWDDSLQSKEKIEANLLSKHEAAIRRERALAYAFSHQVMLFSSNSRVLSNKFPPFHRLPHYPLLNCRTNFFFKKIE